MPLVSEKTPRWRNIVGMVLLLAIFAVVVVTARQGSNVQRAVNATRESVDRTDCARRVNAEQSSARDAATLADRAANRADGLATSYYFNAALSSQLGVKVTQENVDEFTALLREAETLRDQADKADQVVADLPDPAKEVERRCPG